MLKKIESKNMGQASHGWLNSKFHFSFAEYYNPENIHFGALRVINDDLIKPQTGFGTHPHKDMEIISYMVDGELTHEDSMGNKKTVTRGQVQYMSAGTGVYHSEHNFGEKTLRLLQIWIFPQERDLKPNYGDFAFKWEDRINTWLHMVSSVQGNAPVKIYQDVNIYSSFIEEGRELDFQVHKGRQAYLVQIEGSSVIQGSEGSSEEIFQQDAMEITEENINIKSQKDSHFLIIEMKKSK